MNDEELFRLIKNVQEQPEGSRQYQRSIRKLLNECQKLPNLRKSSHPNYLDALNQTWEWVWRNIKSFDLRLHSVRNSLAAWINGYLSWRIKDLDIRSYANFLSLEELLQKNEEKSELASQLLGSSWATACCNPLENYIKQAEVEEIRRIGLALKEIIKADSQDRLKSIYLKERAECNCRMLSQRLLLKDPSDTLVLLSRELQINPKTLLSHWKKNVSLASRKWRLNLITNLDTFMNEIGKQQISVPLNPEAHRLALEFAKEQHNPQKGKKVYLNTLAVYAVHSYLKWLRIDSDLTQGESWNPGLRALFDVADLVLPGIGKLECRRILPEEMGCVLPIDVTDDRIGYVGVKFEEDLKKVYLVGFISEIDSLEPPERLEITDFQPIEALAEKIWHLEEGDLLIQTSQLSPKEALVNLQQWLENIFEPGWQSIESLLSRGSDNLASGVRNAPPKALPSNLSRAKLIEIEGSVQSLVLVVMLLSPQTGSEIDIRVEIHNKNRQAYLSPNLLINILNQNGQVEMTAPSKSNVSSIKLEFGVAPGERFSVQLLLGDVEVIENFVM